MNLTPIRRLTPTARHPKRSKPRLLRLAPSKDREALHPAANFHAALPQAGFTLLELLIVMTIIATLAAVAIPSFVRTVRAAHEAALKEDLYVMRGAIDSYTVDKEKAPQSLQDLVSARYLKSIPKDPITGRADTWSVAQEESMTTIDQTQPGISDVHSGAQLNAMDGTSYSSW